MALTLRKSRTYSTTLSRSITKTLITRTSKTAKDIDDDFDLSEEAFNKRFRQVSEEELPGPVRKRREAARRKLKSRVTIYLDTDIVSRFKETAEKEKTGYQTLINNALRKLIDDGEQKTESHGIKEDLLKDKKFLKKLKAALAA